MEHYKALVSNQLFSVDLFIVLGYNWNIMLLEELTTDDVKQYLQEKSSIILPVGSTEQHGPANPLGTDFMAANHIAQKACAQTNTICAPVIPIGLSEHHAKFSGTIWLSARLYVELMKEYALSLAFHGFDHFIFLNGHGGNTAALKEVAESLYFKHKLLAVVINWWQFLDEEELKEIFPVGTFGHAEAVETSINLALNPPLVKMESISTIKAPEKWGKFLQGISLPAYTNEFAADGVTGSLEGISGEAGSKVLETVIPKLVEFIEEFQNID
ncbi:MAG: hypothetical protein GF308_09575 [Candidatus Heimdallarchaeota archaeon]|nr:hypothetical protein [Candidatus Heimdallarchaeota archaeon]